MLNKVRQAFDQINENPKVHQTILAGIQDGKAKRRHLKLIKRTIISVTATLIIGLGGFFYFQHQSRNLIAEGPVQLEPLKIDVVDGKVASSIPLIIYKGNCYIQTRSFADISSLEALQGEKIGETKGSLDELNTRYEYATELTSTEEGSSVYKVNGYDENFRIMVVKDNKILLFDNLFNKTVTSGSELVDWFQLEQPIKQVKFRYYSDWNNERNTFYPIETSLITPFIEGLKKAKPIEDSAFEEEMGNFRNDDQFRELYIVLQDGIHLRLVLIKGGYVLYDMLGVVFEVDHENFDSLWNAME